ncbi:MAG: GYD domain-containing protein [Pseudonocardiales bacterium]|nr:GYD domain-containing protein [Pseudonocardiales bacterium]
MPLYLGRFAYTSDAIKSLVDDPQDRAEAAAQAAESLGAKLIGLWYAFGEFDGVFLVEAPDNATVAALAMLAGASGALAKTETTVLLTMEEAQEAMRKAGGATFRPPG